MYFYFSNFQLKVTCVCRDHLYTRRIFNCSLRSKPNTNVHKNWFIWKKATGKKSRIYSHRKESHSKQIQWFSGNSSAADTEATHTKLVFPGLKTSLHEFYGCHYELVDGYEISISRIAVKFFPFTYIFSYLYHRQDLPGCMSNTTGVYKKQDLLLTLLENTCFFGRGSVLLLCLYFCVVRFCFFVLCRVCSGQLRWGPTSIGSMLI